MGNVSEIQFDKDGIVIWTVGSDDFWIGQDDFIKVFRAMRDWRKSKFAKKKKVKINKRKPSHKTGNSEEKKQ